MKQRYEPSQRLIAGLIIVTLFIQSCTNSTTATVPEEETPILDFIPQMNGQGPLNQLALSKFIPEKEHEVTSASQAEEFLNEDLQGEAFLIAEEEKVEAWQEQKCEWSVAKDLTEQKVKLTELSKDSEDPTAACLGKLGVFPIEMIEKILTYLPCDKIRKEKRGEQEVTGIFAIRQINRFFYELTTGYSQPGLLGLEHRPNRCIHLEACAVSKIISFDKLNLATVPSFIFYQFIRKVRNLPKEFCPYLQRTNIHSIYAAPKSVIEAVELIKNLEGSKVHTVDFGASDVGRDLGVGLGEVAKSLQGSKVYTISLPNNYIKGEATVEFTKNLAGTEVHTLDLRSNDIGDECLAEIAKNLQSTQVHTLYLGGNDIGDEELGAFAKNLQYTQVHTLDLGGNNIEKVGLMEFTKNLVGTEVKEIGLSHNKIVWDKIKSTQEILEFAKILATTKVRKIDLSWTYIYPRERSLLVKNYPHIKWKFI